MEALGSKILVIVLYAISTPIYVAYCMFVKGMNLHEIIIDDHVQTSLDIFFVSFYAYFAYIKVFCGNIHNVFENIFFYIGGFLTILWAIYRALAQYEDYKMKKQANEFQKKVFKEADKL